MQRVHLLRTEGTDHGIAGTLEDPIVVRSAGDELQLGCTGCPADSHIVRWLVVSIRAMLSPGPMAA